jgi:hypothetical protein
VLVGRQPHRRGLTCGRHDQRRSSGKTRSSPGWRLSVEGEGAHRSGCRSRWSGWTSHWIRSSVMRRIGSRSDGCSWWPARASRTLIHRACRLGRRMTRLRPVAGGRCGRCGQWPVSCRRRCGRHGVMTVRAARLHDCRSYDCKVARLHGRTTSRRDDAIGSARHQRDLIVVLHGGPLSHLDEPPGRLQRAGAVAWPCGRTGHERTRAFIWPLEPPRPWRCRTAARCRRCRPPRPLPPPDAPCECAATLLTAAAPG